MICEFGRKFEPVTEISSAADPALAVFGLKLVIVGGPLRMLTLKLAAPPSGGGFEMIPSRTPGASVFEAGRLNEIELPDTTPPTPPSVADVAAMNPVPSTVTVTAPEPAGIDVGVTRVMVGAGLTAATALTVRVCGGVVPPPG